MTAQDLQREYESLRPDAVRLCEALKRELEKKFSTKALTLGIPLQARVKDWDSIAGKLDRKELSLNSLKELDDFIGIRGVFLFRRDLIAAQKLIESTFEILSEEDTASRLDESEFGYQSLHFVVKPPRSWPTVPSFEGLDEFRCELQMRTLAQHIWASASHQLQYKHEESVPQPIRRTIHRASALLETVDLELERVLQEREQYLTTLNVRGSDQLNVDSLARVLNEMLPPPNKVDDENYSELLTDLTAFDVLTTAALREFIKKHLHEAISEDKAHVAELQESGTTSATTKERLKKGVFYSHIGLVRRMMRVEYGTKFLNYRTAKRRKARLAASRARKGKSITPIPKE
jgi:ppGpp synthetase/RelA/SpoT-type nucleotidyltranferase